MTSEQLDKIDRYISREMSEEELEAFRAELESDTELRKEFNLARLTAAAVQRDPAHLEAFKKKFLEARPVQPPADAFWKNPWILWAMAALALLLLAIWLLRPERPSKSLNDASIAAAGEQEPIDATRLPLEKLDAPGTPTATDTFKIEVYPASAPATWQHEFDGSYFLGLYAPAQPAYRQGQIKRVVQWNSRYFLLIENQWFEFFATGKDIKKDLVPVQEPELLKLLPVQ